MITTRLDFLKEAKDYINIASNIGYSSACSELMDKIHQTWNQLEQLEILNEQINISKKIVRALN